MPFTDRVDAGRQLAAALAHYKAERPVVLALPRGGVPVAAEIATALDAPLDIVLVRKIGVPFHLELAMGAVVDGPAPLTVRNREIIASAGVSDAMFDLALDRELREIGRRREYYLGGRARVDIAGRTVIVVDDGVATGATTRAALRAVRAAHPARIVLAIPVAPTAILADLRTEADDTVCLEHYADFSAVGYFYGDFGQVSDAEVVNLLASHPASKSPS